jgi:probable aminopeptidase NPEPL1
MPQSRVLHLVSGGKFSGTFGHTPRRCTACYPLNWTASGWLTPSSSLSQIIKLYSGKTVEVNNTDAEGRLVLGDGVAYAVKHLSPTVIFDMATLTGAQGIATGLRHAGIFCNNDDLEKQVIASGKASGNLVHPVSPFVLTGSVAFAVKTSPLCCRVC